MSVRFLVTADLHVNQTSRSSYDHKTGLPTSWIEAFNRLDEIVDIANEYDVDHILIGGDLFDEGLPTPENVGLVKDSFSRLDRGRLVWVTEGNHEHRGITGKHRTAIEVFLSDQPWCGGFWSKPGIADIDGVEVVMAPWWRVAGTDSLGTDSVALENEIISLGEKVKGPSLLLGHLTVAEADFRNKSVRGAENLIRDNVLEALVPTETLESGPWSAALLGHIHKAQSFGEKTRYLGSSFPITYGEGQKSVEILDMFEDGRVKTKKVPLDHRLLEVVDLSESPSKKAFHGFTDSVMERYRSSDMVRVVVDSGQTLTPEESDAIRELRAAGVTVSPISKPDTKKREAGLTPSVEIADISILTPSETLEKWVEANAAKYDLTKKSQKRITNLFADIMADAEEVDDTTRKARSN